MRLSRTRGVPPTASKMLLHLMAYSGAWLRDNLVLGLCHTLFQFSTQPCADVAAYGEGDTFGTAEYFERNTVGADCGLFAGGEDWQHDYSFGDNGDGAGRTNRGSG